MFHQYSRNTGKNSPVWHSSYRYFLVSPESSTSSASSIIRVPGPSHLHIGTSALDHNQSTHRRAPLNQHSTQYRTETVQYIVLMTAYSGHCTLHSAGLLTYTEFTLHSTVENKLYAVQDVRKHRNEGTKALVITHYAVLTHTKHLSWFKPICLQKEATNCFFA